MTPFAFYEYTVHPDAYKFSDDSQIGQVKASDGNSSNYRFFEIQPIKWIVLNYNYLPAEYGTGGNGTHTRLELFSNDILISGVDFGEKNHNLWKDSTINVYLNFKFNKEAFPKTLLPASTIFNNLDNTDSDNENGGSNNNYLTEGLSPTIQSLYLLSYYEISNENSPYVKNKVFESGSAASATRQARGSDYAKAHGMYVAIVATKTLAYWWPRTAASNSSVYYIHVHGVIEVASSTNISGLGTRPAMQGGHLCPL